MVFLILKKTTKYIHYQDFSSNPNVTLELIENNPDFLWDFDKLSRNEMSKHIFFTRNQTNYVLK